MGAIHFQVEKMYRLPDAGNLKAFVDVSVNDALVIKGIRVLSGKKGLFVSMPQEKGKDDKWYDQIICKNAGVYAEFSDYVIGHFQKAQSE